MSSGRKQPVFDLGAANVWSCEHCKAQGPADFGPEETAYSAIEKIREAHRRLSPECKGGNDHRIQIVNFERVKAKGRVA